LLERVPHTRDAALEHFQRDERTLSNVQYTISATWLPYVRGSPVHHAARRFSLHEWINGNSILLLGNMEDLRYPIDAVNRAIFQRLVELVLSQSESSTRRTWFFLDELKEMSRLDALPRLLTMAAARASEPSLPFRPSKASAMSMGTSLPGRSPACPPTSAFCAPTAKNRPVALASWARLNINSGCRPSVTTARVPSPSRSSEGHRAPFQFLRLPLADRERFWSYCVTPAIGVYYGDTYFANALCPRARPRISYAARQRAVLARRSLPIDDPETPSLDDFSRTRFSLTTRHEQ